MYTSIMTINIIKLLLSIFLIWVSVYDIKNRKIENLVHIVIIFAAFSVTEIFIGERITGLIFCFLPAGTASFTTGKIGMGDAKLAAAFGFVLGVYRGLASLIAGLLLFVIITSVYTFMKKKKIRSYPLAPYLSAGFLLFLYLN